MTCELCGHDWHGLPCTHDAVVRQGWTLQRESCDCRSALPVGVSDLDEGQPAVSA